mgnify:CR=1 FL=1
MLQDSFIETSVKRKNGLTEVVFNTFLIAIAIIAIFFALSPKEQSAVPTAFTICKSFGYFISEILPSFSRILKAGRAGKRRALDSRSSLKLLTCLVS